MLERAPPGAHCANVSKPERQCGPEARAPIWKNVQTQSDRLQTPLTLPRMPFNRGAIGQNHQKRSGRDRSEKERNHPLIVMPAGTETAGSGDRVAAARSPLAAALCAEHA